MELGEHDGDMGAMPLPMLVTSYGAPPNIHESSSKVKPPGVNADHHQNGSAGTGAGTSSDETRTADVQPVKKSVRYRECQKNHAASIGGHAIDGCGDFMPSGEEGTLEALKCAACNCHRNFHRREVEGEPPCYYCYNSRKDARRRSGGGGGGGGGGTPSMAPLLQSTAPPLALPAPSRYPPHQMIMALSGDSDDGGAGGYMNTYGGGGGGGGGGMAMSMMKKRFRTKFTSEQKEKMSAFAEKLGWRIQKQDEAAVQQFCIDVGVKRHVLKVWMHNNKSNVLAKSNREQCSSQ